jgi:hypothetical protein
MRQQIKKHRLWEITFIISAVYASLPTTHPTHPIPLPLLLTDVERMVSSRPLHKIKLRMSRNSVDHNLDVHIREDLCLAYKYK